MNNQNSCYLDSYMNKFDNILCAKSNILLMKRNVKCISYDFINTLITLNYLIICLCNNILMYTKISTLCQVVENIILNKKQEIKQLNRLLCNSRFEYNQDEDIQRYLTNSKEIIENMIVAMKDTDETLDINQTFIVQMVQNLNALINLCNNVLEYPILQELAPIINYIVIKSNNNIEQLEQINSSIS